MKIWLLFGRSLTPISIGFARWSKGRWIRFVASSALLLAPLSLVDCGTGREPVDGGRRAMDAYPSDAVGRACSSSSSCDDGVACTSDSCDRITMTCRNEPLDLNCETGLTCDAARGCVLESDQDAGACRVPGEVCATDADCCVGLCGERCGCFRAGEEISTSDPFGPAGCGSCCSRTCEVDSMSGQQFCRQSAEGGYCMTSADCTTGLCSDGICIEPACPPGHADCNGDPADGCEADLASTATCGSCDNECGQLGVPHMVATCTDGTCGQDCEGSWWDCDGVLSNGCEVDLSEGPCECLPAGLGCSRASDCCSEMCVSGRCCGATGDYCSADPDCCLVDHVCRANRCCRTYEASCASNTDCCSGVCAGGRCST